MAHQQRPLLPPIEELVPSGLIRHSMLHETNACNLTMDIAGHEQSQAVYTLHFLPGLHIFLTNNQYS